MKLPLCIALQSPCSILLYLSYPTRTSSRGSSRGKSRGVMDKQISTSISGTKVEIFVMIGLANEVSDLCVHQIASTGRERYPRAAVAEAARWMMNVTQYVARLCLRQQPRHMHTCVNVRPIPPGLVSSSEEFLVCKCRDHCHCR